MMSYEKLVKNTRRFRAITGMSAKEFDLLVSKVEKKYPRAEKKRLSRENRVRAIGAGRRFALNVRDQVMLLLFYYRTYCTQDVAAVMFEIGQASVSRSITHIEPILKLCIPIPSKIHDKMQRISSIEELEEILPGLRCLVDASEQKIQRPGRKDMEKSHYSGKAGAHTSKIQYTTNTHGLIVHKTRHSPGKIHDVTVYKKKPPTFPEKIPDEAQVTIYADRGYQGAPEVPGGILCTPIKKKKGAKLTEEQKEYNKIHSKIRVYVEHAIRRVKTWRIMGNVYRNPLIKYDRINDIVCGLVNRSILWRLDQMA